MYDYDLIVVGCGASSYGFLKGLEKNKDFKDKKIAVLCPSEYKENTVNCNIKGISPKFLQDENVLPEVTDVLNYPGIRQLMKRQ